MAVDPLIIDSVQREKLAYQNKNKVKQGKWVGYLDREKRIGGRMFLFHLRNSLVLPVGGRSHVFCGNDVFNIVDASLLGRNVQCVTFNNRFSLLSCDTVNFRC